MSITIEAVYEDGILKPNEPLPLAERERVQVVIHRTVLLADQTCGMLGFSGDADAFDRLLKESADDVLEHA
jgi:predicted DNA-binding antitoxin AbrB/MazE fold protein